MKYLATVTVTCLIAPLLLGAQDRIDTAVALENVINRVDPVAPEEVTRSGVGGPVYADVVVDENGTVSSVQVLAGPELLHDVAVDALRQWTFEPFFQGGRPVSVVVLIEVPFPDPVRDEERRISERFRASEIQCRRQLEGAPNTALAPCQEAVDFSASLPLDRRIERSMARSLLGQVYFLNEQFRDALGHFEAAMEIRSESGRPEIDDGVASLWELTALAHFALGDLGRADEALGTSVRIYDAAIVAFPNFADRYTPRLEAALRRHADLKVGMGDLVAAAALLGRADRMEVEINDPKSLPTETIVAGVRAISTGPSRLTEEDLDHIRALLPEDAPEIWVMFESSRVMSEVLFVELDVYLKPDFSSPELRTGRTIGLGVAPDRIVLPAQRFDPNAPKQWRQIAPIGRYGQIPVAGSDPDDVRTGNERWRPFRLIEPPDTGTFTNDEILRIARFLEENAVEPTQRPFLYNDIQPWAIRQLFRTGANEVDVGLGDPEGNDGQYIRLKIEPEGITVLELQ